MTYDENINQALLSVIRFHSWQIWLNLAAFGWAVLLFWPNMMWRVTTKR